MVWKRLYIIPFILHTDVFQFFAVFAGLTVFEHDEGVK